MIKISIITPVYNGSEFIEGCLKNVISQGCLDEIEHIIQDGCSTDRTLEIAQKYCNQHNHIKVFSEKDKGQADALNKGTSYSTGEVIGCLNVDDRYSDGLIRQVIAWMNTCSSPRFIVGNCNVWDPKGNLIQYNRPRGISFETILSPRHHTPANALSYFYDRQAHNNIGGFDINEEFALDYDFLFRILRVTKQYYYNHLFGDFYRHKKCKTHLSLMNGTNMKHMKNAYTKNLKRLKPYEHARLQWFLSNHQEYNFKSSFLFHLSFARNHPLYFSKLFFIYIKDHYINKKNSRFGFFH